MIILLWLNIQLHTGLFAEMLIGVLGAKSASNTAELHSLST